MGIFKISEIFNLVYYFIDFFLYISVIILLLILVSIIMFLKIFLYSSIFFIFSCSNFENLFYCPRLDQGNYLLKEDIDKVKLGMKKEKIIEILGRPMINDLLSGNILYYISYEKSGCNLFKKKKLILFFNNSDLLFKVKS